MSSVLDPEVQLAQRLASNEKPLRTKALKKLRKYINVRSHIGTGSFTADELLKLWKGLFYCLWMQDKPLLQEELSNQISNLIHIFHDLDGQMLYLESFLQTVKREWTGIDRLRMDKFFQLVRFMFRQTFEMLKRKNWDSCVVSRFLELLTTQLLQGGSETPSGLQFHILDLYMTELAAVGSAELTADQNLTFIEPFCKTAAKTKDRSLFTAICNSILSTIIEQAPFAVEDLMKEMKAAEDSDSGQSSEEDPPEEKKSNPVSKKDTWKQIKSTTPGNKSNEAGDGDDDDDDDDDDLHLEDSDTEMSCDDDIGPVLQFDYAALADKLFVLASRSSTPSQNRQRLYKIIKVLRDLSEGIFPQDEDEEEVSTDEDDEMFGSRKRMKRGKGHIEEDDEGVPAAKKRKKKDASTLHKQTKDQQEQEPADLTVKNENKKKKRKKKKKAGQCEGTGAEEKAERCEEEEAQCTVKEAEGGLGGSQSEDSEKKAQVTEAATPEGQSETLLLSQVTVTEETPLQTPCTTDNRDHSEMVHVETEKSPEPGATVSRKKRKKARKAKLQTNEIVIKMQVNAEAEIIGVSSEESIEKNTTPETDATTVTKKKKKGLKAKKPLEETEGGSLVNGVSTEVDFTSICCNDSKEDGLTTTLEKPTDSQTTSSKKRRKKNLKADKAPKPEADAQCEAEGKDTDEVPSVPSKKKTNAPAVDESTVTPLKNEYSEDRAAPENPQVEDAEKLFEISMTKPAKNKKKLSAAQVEVVSSGKPAKKKKRKIPVEFEYEADELEAAAQKATLTSGPAEGQTPTKKSAKSGLGELSTPMCTKKSQKKVKTSTGSASDFISFKRNHIVPTPLFCKTKGGPITLLSSQKKSQTPKSESKKVTFGLKNNKTAEFRKTDRSLLVSPDGSSRVPFDPEQKPKFGVLKSPPITRSARKTKKKTALDTPKSTPKRRPSAADFF
ncbi:ribosomal RNA processing protein 1 homolog B-like isoform X2 [Centropristis striata]|uniref:ribosomal RNA processing protein 1 homolog B-like isoform X2 n=1 Tax=Centropristis striata TaxID=184440 RepID=UPI0027E05DB9|nr:ribosomal RNA processing protein 1 homolog B-like isoform X2 [Centropristis striata]